MKKFLINILESIINYLKVSTQTIAVQKDLPLSSLSPVSNADEDGYYSEVLYWALKNRKEKNIKNIAITGPYGSGKSSILNTFQENFKTDKDLQFLNISLATFKEEDIIVEGLNGEEGINGNTIQSESLLRLIELSILQQIFYRESDEKIPDSRFKKIKSLKKSQTKKLAIALVLLLISFTYQIWPDLLPALMRIKFLPWVDFGLHFLTLILIIVLGFLVILNSVRSVRGMTISKLNLQNAEVQIDSSINKSILNSHLDEILYFFEVTEYTVVVIEDLDRFRQTEIFTKLREINLLINNSEKIPRDVAFIYAVRDDMFQDKDRTKFFDFIIPVIPVINSSNSGEKLRDLVKKNKFKIKEDLIEDISLFIDDMRLLYNITNEYYLYHKQLGKNLNPDKVLAMIVYKNIFPNDFVKLGNGEGELHGVFNKKEKYVAELVEKYDFEINGIRKEILTLDANQIKNIVDLRKLYVLEYVTNIGNNIVSFSDSQRSYNYSEVLADNLFEQLRKNELSYNYQRDSSYSLRSANVATTFDTIEKLVDPMYTYDERALQVEQWNADKGNSLRKKIDELEGKKRQAKYLKISNIVSMNGLEINLENSKQKQLITIMLRRGYIDEHYLDYVSIFYEGSLSRQDQDFLLNVKAQIKVDFDFKLNKIDNLISKIDSIEFENEYILNYEILDSIILKATYKAKKEALFVLLAKETATTLEFIDGYVSRGRNQEYFIKELVKAWPNIWNSLMGASFSNEKLNTYFELIIRFADVKDVGNLTVKDNFTVFISNYTDFLKIPAASDKLKKIVSALDIKFLNLELLDGVDEELQDFIYSNNHYSLSIAMIRRVLGVNGDFSEDDFEERNYYAINNSGAEKLIEYIDENLDEYIENVYLKLPNNEKEDDEFLVWLLNNGDLSSENKTKILLKTKTKISKLDAVDEIEMKRQLLSMSKVVPEWNNVIHFYQQMEKSFDSTLSEFMSKQENYSELSTEKIDVTKPVVDLETIKSFLKDLLLSNEVHDDAYKLILKSIPYYYTELEAEELSAGKVEALIYHRTLRISSTTFSMLKDHFEKLHITLAEINHTEFINKISDYVLTGEDARELLKSDKFSVDEKQKIVDHIGDGMIVNDLVLLVYVGYLSSRNPHFIASKEVITTVLAKSHIGVDEKIRLFNRNISNYEKSEGLEIISALGRPFSEIGILGKRPLLPNTLQNREFAECLKQLGYIKNWEIEKKGVRISTFRK